MKDFLGQELAVGDTVVTMVPSYRSLRLLKVLEFTPKNVRLEDKRTWKPNGTFLQHPSQVVKVPPSEASDPHTDKEAAAS